MLKGSSLFSALVPDSGHLAPAPPWTRLNAITEKGTTARHWQEDTLLAHCSSVRSDEACDKPPLTKGNPSCLHTNRQLAQDEELSGLVSWENNQATLLPGRPRLLQGKCAPPAPSGGLAFNPEDVKSAHEALETEVGRNPSTGC